MDEATKKRLVQVWLRALYISLWSVGVIAILLLATWLGGLGRYVAFAALGVAVGAYLSGRAESLVDQIARAVLAVITVGVATWLAVAVGRNPAVLVPYGAAVVAFLLYGAAVLTTVWFVRAVAGKPVETAETAREEPELDRFMVAESSPEPELEVVQQAEAPAEEAETAAAERSQG